MCDYPPNQLLCAESEFPDVLIGGFLGIGFLALLAIFTGCFCYKNRVHRRNRETVLHRSRYIGLEAISLWLVPCQSPS